MVKKTPRSSSRSSPPWSSVRPLLVSVVAFTLLWSNTATELIAKTILYSAKFSSTPKGMEGQVYYELVEEVDNADEKFKRFAAFYHDDHGSHPLPVLDWMLLFRGEHQNQQGESKKKSARLIQHFNAVLKEASMNYNAIFFETKGVSSTNASTKQFEFVVMDAPQLNHFASGSLGYEAFAEELEGPWCSSQSYCCTFKNLSGSANLIVPKKPLPPKPMEVYTHLLPFIRNVSDNEIIILWQMVAKEFIKSLEASPRKTRWLSTSGTGVAWLHVRIDNQPKYYTYDAFRKEL